VRRGNFDGKRLLRTQTSYSIDGGEKAGGMVLGLVRTNVLDWVGVHRQWWVSLICARSSTLGLFFGTGIGTCEIAELFIVILLGLDLPSSR
jgi:hypothetical protein